MKKLIFLVIIICFSWNSYGQIEFRVKTMKISNITFDLNSDYIDEEYEDGPYFHLNCVMKNISSDSIFLNTSTSHFYVEYTFDNEVFKEKLEVLQWSHEEVAIPLANCEKINFIMGINIFLGTSILKENKENYTSELIKILPTLKIIYVDNSSNIRLVLLNVDCVELTQ